MYIAEFYKALSQLVTQSVREHDIIATVIAGDLSEPIVRPSIKIMLDDVCAEQVTTHQNIRHVTARIYYFPPERKLWRGAHWSMMDALTDGLIDGVTVNQFTVYPDDSLEFSNTDGVLIATQSFSWYEDRETHDIGEFMDSLQVNLK